MKKNGFTLIELLVIIALVGILSTVGVISYTKISKVQKDKLKVANIALIETAAVKYGEANKEQVKEGNKTIFIENNNLTAKNTKNSLTVTVEVLKYLGYLDEKNEGIEEIKDSEKILLYIDNNKVKAKYAGSAFNFNIKQTNEERQESEATIGITVNPAEDEEGDYTYKCEIQGNSNAKVKVNGTEKTLEEMGEQTISRSELGVSFTIKNLSRGVNLITGRTPNSHILTCTVTSGTSGEGITLTKTTKIYTTKETELTVPKVEVKIGDDDYEGEWINSEDEDDVCINLEEEGSGISYTYNLYRNGEKMETKPLNQQICFLEDGIYEIEIGVGKNGFSLNDKGYAIIKRDKTPPENLTVTMNKWKSNNQNPKPNDTNAHIANVLGEEYIKDTWSNRSIYAEANATDDTSGIDYYLYTTSGATASATNVRGKYRNVEAEGTSSVQFKAYDKAGNCSKPSDSKSMKIDKTAPKCDSKYQAGSSNWTNQNVTITGTCSDPGGSGCNNNNTLSKTYSTNTNGSYSPGTFYDNAGNYKECDKKTVRIDKTPPTVTISSKDNDNYNLECSCTDNGGSGCNSDSKTWSGPVDSTGHSNGNGGQASCAYYDKAGNYGASGQKSTYVKCTKTTPKGKLPDKPDSNNYVDAPVKAFYWGPRTPNCSDSKHYIQYKNFLEYACQCNYDNHLGKLCTVNSKPYPSTHSNGAFIYYDSEAACNKAKNEKINHICERDTFTGSFYFHGYYWYNGSSNSAIGVPGSEKPWTINSDDYADKLNYSDIKAACKDACEYEYGF